jgi:hypothetical protein
MIAEFLSVREFISKIRLLCNSLSKIIIADHIIKGIYCPLFKDLFYLAKDDNPENWPFPSLDDEASKIDHLVKDTISAFKHDKSANNQVLDQGDYNQYHFGEYNLKIRDILALLFDIFAMPKSGKKMGNNILYSRIASTALNEENGSELFHQLNDAIVEKISPGSTIGFDEYATKLDFSITPLFILLFNISPWFVSRCIEDGIITSFGERGIDMNYLLLYDRYEPDSWIPQDDCLPEITTSLRCDIEDSDPYFRENLSSDLEFSILRFFSHIKYPFTLEEDGILKINLERNITVQQCSYDIDNFSIIRKIIVDGVYLFTTHQCGLNESNSHFPIPLEYIPNKYWPRVIDLPEGPTNLPEDEAAIMLLLEDTLRLLEDEATIRLLLEDAP